MLSVVLGLVMLQGMPKPPSGMGSVTMQADQSSTSLAMVRSAKDAPNCGVEHEAACKYQNKTTWNNIHWCVSRGGEVGSTFPTVGAIPELTPNGKYKCIECGQPFQRACECTQEDTPLQYPKPCANGIIFWCLHYPIYVAMTNMTTGLKWCRHNISDAERKQEEHCGKEGYEACFNEKSGTYSCDSPSDKDEKNFIIAPHSASSDMDTLADVNCIRCGCPQCVACSAEYAQDFCDKQSPDNKIEFHGAIEYCCTESEPYESSNGMVYCGVPRDSALTVKLSFGGIAEPIPMSERNNDAENQQNGMKLLS
jgi:hypothetical protein